MEVWQASEKYDKKASTAAHHIRMKINISCAGWHKKTAMSENCGSLLFVIILQQQPMLLQKLVL